LESIVVEQSKTIPVKGSTSIPAERANGTVVFRNLTDALVGIPAGTVVSSAATPAVRFATTSDVVIAPVSMPMWQLRYRPMPVQPGTCLLKH
jgi:hypothetical protein